MHTVVILHHPTDKSQKEISDSLEEVVKRLEKAEYLKNPHLETIFPGDETVKYKGHFILWFEGKLLDTIETLKQFKDIKTAYAAPSRSELQDAPNRKSSGTANLDPQ